MEAVSLEFRSLGQLSEVVRISKGFPTQRTQDSGQFAVFSVSELRDAQAPTRFADRADLDELGLHPASPGDVLLTIEGPNLGEVFVVPQDTEPFVCARQAVAMTVVDLPRVIHPSFLGAWLCSQRARRQLATLCAGRTIRRISFQYIRNLMVPLLPWERQLEIAKRFDAIETARLAHRAVVNSMETMQALEVELAFADLNAVSLP